MKNVSLVGVMMAVAIVVAGGVYMFVPSLDNDRSVLHAEVSEHVERARRLLGLYDENQERIQLIVGNLRAAGVEALDQDRVAELVESDRELLLPAEQRMQETARQQRSRRQRAGSVSSLAEQVPLPAPQDSFGRNTPQLTQAIVEGLRARDALEKENERLLSEALDAVRSAASVQQGQMSGADVPLTKRIEGRVLMAQGLALHRKAQLARESAQGPLVDISRYAADLTLQTGEQAVAEVADFASRADATEQKKAQAEAELSRLSAEVDQLEAKISDLEQRRDEQQRIADASRAELDRLAAQGVDFADPQGLQRFAAEYSEQSATYREALERLQAIEFGTLNDAKLDPGTDPLLGGYVPDDHADEISPQRGRLHFQADLDALVAQRNATQSIVDALGNEIARMRQTATELDDRAAHANALQTDIEQRIGDSYLLFEEAIAEAYEFEEQALQKLKSAASAYQAAGRAAQARQQGARDAADAYGTAADRSAPQLLAGESQAPAVQTGNAGDAQLRAAMIHYERMRGLSAEATALLALGDHKPEGADPSALQEQAAASRDAGIEAVDAALDSFVKASRGMNQHFSLTASIASAYYLQSLMDRPELIEAAIQNYEAVVSGREDNEKVRDFMTRLSQLRGRR